MKTPDFDREKFKDAFHYVIARAGGHPGFGAVKLYKVLWFSDSKTYVRRGTPITGEQYIRLQHGPVPKHARETLAELEAEGRISARKSAQDYAHWRFKSLRPANVNRFSNDEMDVLNYWIKVIDTEHTAQSISDETHDDYAWEIARMGEPLPYFAFLANRLRDPTEADFERARRRWGPRG
jgi:hypothetical protein